MNAWKICSLTEEEEEEDEEEDEPDEENDDGGDGEEDEEDEEEEEFFTFAFEFLLLFCADEVASVCITEEEAKGSDFFILSFSMLSEMTLPKTE